jgi:hypothetical protein
MDFLFLVECKGNAVVESQQVGNTRSCGNKAMLVWVEQVVGEKVIEDGALDKSFHCLTEMGSNAYGSVIRRILSIAFLVDRADCSFEPGVGEHT